MPTTLKQTILQMIEAYPEALEQREKFDLIPYQLITHRRLKSANSESYGSSPIVQYVLRILGLDKDFWKLVQSLRRAQGGIHSEAYTCENVQANLFQLEERLVRAMKQEGVDTNVDSKEFTCSENQRLLCQACPSIAELLARVSTQLSHYTLALDNDDKSDTGL
jgi:hypothetical protein